MRSTLPGQFDLPQTSPDLAGLARLKAKAPLRAAKPQSACDIGLFSDDALQADLLDMPMFMDGRHEP